MGDQLLHALVESENEAADEVLIEALRLGTPEEQAPVLEALLQRRSIRGLEGVIEHFELLPQALRRRVLESIGSLHQALREAGRSDRTPLRLMAMKLIAMARQGKLGYVLSENLNSGDEQLARGAVEAMLELAVWVAEATGTLQKEGEVGGSIEDGGLRIEDGASPQEDEHEDEGEQRGPAGVELYRELISQRDEIEQMIARAMDVYRGRHGHELLRAALLVCDWPGSKTLAILQTTRHGGQSQMVRRLQQPPEAEHVPAFLLGAAHGGLRSHFGIVFSHIDQPQVQDALLHRTHWLKDHQLQLCIHQVTRGCWWGSAELMAQTERLAPAQAVKIAEWLAVSGMPDVVQDERMETLYLHAAVDFPARLRLLRIALRRRQGASTGLLRMFFEDPDERLARVAVREIVRRRPADFENLLLQQMTTAPESVRRIIGRAVGHVGFEQFWQRFDRLDVRTRQQAGRAMLKLLPDAPARLARRLSGGPVDQTIKALQIVQELNLAEALRIILVQLCRHANARVRSKAVAVLGENPAAAPDAVLERVLNDSDARVRANAIEVLENTSRAEYLPLLMQRARASTNRERANAIKALHRMKVGTAAAQLLNMLRDPRPEHRISALWAMRQLGVWQMLHEVGRLAREDQSVRVRRYALAILRGVAGMAALDPEREAG